MTIFDSFPCISRINLAIMVKSGTASPVHNDRSSHGLAFTPKGSMYYHFNDGKSITVPDNSIIYLPKHSYYTVDPKQSADCFAINFDFPEDCGGDPVLMHVKNYNAFLTMFRSAAQSWAQKETGYLLHVNSCLYEIFYLIKKEQEIDYLSGNTTTKILPAIEYIRKHYTDASLTISNLALICNMSDTYFRRIFYCTYGTLPYRYIIELRLTRAKELLESRYYSVHLTAELCGYQNDSTFSREFKRFHGISPSEVK